VQNAQTEFKIRKNLKIACVFSQKTQGIIRAILLNEALFLTNISRYAIININIKGKVFE